MKKHLQMLGQSFRNTFIVKRFPFFCKWKQDLFFFNIEFMDDNDKMKEELVQMKTSNKIKMEFDCLLLDTFWCAQLNIFPQSTKNAFEILVPIATTYLCKIGFSTLLKMKTNVRNRLNPSDDIHVSISKNKPCFYMIIDKKTATKDPLICD